MRASFYHLSMLLIGLSVLMLFPAIVEYVDRKSDWLAFSYSFVFTLFFGTVFLLLNRNAKIDRLSRKDMLFFVIATWTVFSLASALPYYLSGRDIGFTAAIFESVSGLTTTGSTVLTGLDEFPPGLLLWRSLTQWIGGLGIIVLGMSLLPFLNSGGQQLFLLESSDTIEKPFPRIGQYAGRIFLAYVALTAACMLLYFGFGMSPFEAVNHAMTTVSTGGFSTSDQSLGHFDSSAVLVVSSIFMLVGGLPFFFLIRLMSGKIEGDSQIKYYLLTMALGVLVIVAYRAASGTGIDADAAVSAVFTVISIVTTTGYASEDYQMWGPPVVSLVFFLTFFGACSGSTSGGFKQFRFAITKAVFADCLARAMRPRQVTSIRYGERVLSPQIVSSTMSFAFLYVATFAVYSVLYELLGLDLASSVSASATALANVGPGIGSVIGPAGNFAALPDMVKWLLCSEMLAGRLELVGVYVFLLPSYYRT